MAVEDVRGLFANQWWLEALGLVNHVWFTEGDLAVDDLDAGRGPWALVVHGDLIGRDLDFATGDYQESLLAVRGSLRARNFLFTAGATCSIAHDMTVDNVIIGRYGDESARLCVEGALRARLLLLDHVTGCDANTIDAIVCSDRGWGLPIDISYAADSHEDTFIRDALDGQTVDLFAVWKVVRDGRDPLVAGAEARLRAARQGLWQHNRSRGS